MKEKEILITNFHPKDGGGHTTYILTLVKKLETTFSIHVACPKTSKLYKTLMENKKIKLHHVDFPFSIKEIHQTITNIKKISALLTYHDIKLAHCNGSPDYKITLLAKKISQSNIKIILTKHNSLPVKKGAIANWQYKHINHLICVAKSQIKTIKNTSMKKNKITVIENGVNLEHFRATTKKETNEIIKIVSVAGTAKHKGWHYLTTAMEKLEKDIQKKFKIMIAGEKPSKEKLTDNELTLIQEEKLVFPGNLSDVRPLLEEGNIGFVLSYKIETISFACREMMAMGLPVITSNYASLPDNITPNIDGWVVPAEDSLTLTQLLNTIACGTYNLEKMSKNARKKAELNFSDETMSQSTKKIYNLMFK